MGTHTARNAPRFRSGFFWNKKGMGTQPLRPHTHTHTPCAHRWEEGWEEGWEEAVRHVQTSALLMIWTTTPRMPSLHFPMAKDGGSFVVQHIWRAEVWTCPRGSRLPGFHLDISRQESKSQTDGEVVKGPGRGSKEEREQVTFALARLRARTLTTPYISHTKKPKSDS